MLIDPSAVFFPAETGKKWGEAVAEVISAGLTAGLGISSPLEAVQALNISAWCDTKGVLHMRAAAPWGKWASIEAAPFDWGFAPGGYPQ